MLAPPGTYTVKISAAGQELTQPLTVLKDPNTAGSESDIAAQTQMVTDIVSDLGAAVDMINTLEAVRGQLFALKTVLARDSAEADVRAQADSLDRKLASVEERLFQMRVTGRGQDLLRWPMRVAEQLGYLAQTVASGDFAPNAPQREVHQELKTELGAARDQFNRVINQDLAAFNTLLQQRSIQGVIARPPAVP
jgi:hypothetical protein